LRTPSSLSSRRAGFALKCLHEKAFSGELCRRPVLAVVDDENPNDGTKNERVVVASNKIRIRIMKIHSIAIGKSQRGT